MRGASGELAATCGSGTTCVTALGEGTYYATVEDSDGAVVGRSRHWSLSAADGAEDLRSNCLSLPIFVPGDQDMPKTTQHDREAIYTAGQPPLLNWTPEPGRAPRSWYDRVANQPNRCGDITGSQACDEYPFRTTLQGGPGASLKPVMRSESNIQGGHVSRFYTKCHMRTPDRPTFIVAPAPAHSNIPTLKICNGR